MCEPGCNPCCGLNQAEVDARVEVYIPIVALLPAHLCAIVYGVNAIDKCPASEDLPLYLVTSGAIGVLMMAVFGVLAAKILHSSRDRARVAPAGADEPAKRREAEPDEAGGTGSRRNCWGCPVNSGAGGVNAVMLYVLIFLAVGFFAVTIWGSIAVFGCSSCDEEPFTFVPPDPTNCSAAVCAGIGGSAGLQPAQCPVTCEIFADSVVDAAGGGESGCQKAAAHLGFAYCLLVWLTHPVGVAVAILMAAKGIREEVARVYT